MKSSRKTLLALVVAAAVTAPGCSKIMDQRPYRDQGPIKNLTFVTDVSGSGLFTNAEGYTAVYRVLPGCKGKEFLGNISLENGRSSVALPVDELMLLEFEVVKTNIRAKQKRSKITKETLIRIRPGDRVTVSYYYKNNKYRFGVQVKGQDGKTRNQFLIPWSGCKKMS